VILIANMICDCRFVADTGTSFYILTTGTRIAYRVFQSWGIISLPLFSGWRGGAMGWAHKGFGKIAGIVGIAGVLGAVLPAGSRGRAPGQGIWGQSPQKAKAFAA